MADEIRSPREILLDECEASLGYRFNDRKLLLSALTHTSGASTRDASNERMEFLGDAVLGLVVVDELYTQYPDFQEGQMTQVKSVVVARGACAAFSEQLHLEKYLILGRAMRGARKLPGNVMADAFESVVGAIYIDSNYETARDFILRFLVPEIDRVIKDELTNSSKTLLQQLAQKDFGLTPVYRVLDEQGPEHARSFKIAVEIGERRHAAAWGASKKKAESQAAQNAIDELEGRPPSCPAD